MRLGFNESKLHFVKNAVPLSTQNGEDLSLLPEAKKDIFQVLFVSRFIPAKGLIETIQACAILRDKGFNFALSCVGDGEIRGVAEDLAASLGLSDRVTFTGYIAEEKVSKFLCKSEALVIPTSHDEGFPNVLFKAVAAGLPIVTTKIRAAADYLSEPENCLFCTKDPHDIALKLESLINDAELRTAMSKSNLKFGKSLEPVSIAKEFLAIYRSL
jgi:glycosyltransferase involved in cell wall biosynthesis